MSEQAILFSELPTRDGGRIGLATLNTPKSLNALSLAMIEPLHRKLDDWLEDEGVVAVWLEGAGDKALCAGGDIVALYKAMSDDPDTTEQFASRYFTAEYALDYRIHTYPKPLMVWGNGIVMGGGLGLMAGAPYRLATPRCRIAMPEITIGLYPDIGASWFLNRMPPGIGAYLGLTGAQLNARDALDLGLADRLIPEDQRDELLAALQEADYLERRHTDLHLTVGEVLDRFEARDRAPQGQVVPRLDHLQRLACRGSVTEAVARILADEESDDWLAANRQRLQVGCPLTAHLVWRMLERHRHSSLADAFRDELVLSVRCCTQGDFQEGVRALLIDKDKNPRWSHGSVKDVTPDAVGAMLAPLWSAEEHPLRHL
ncbi:enoyl-CoA hydratase/isomerase family protein [Pistricoccus aurantiacus]|uniref:enoyl-CoA hydratase/isomerase family protein n=1 Tax=Pistricoccus aurantiacus TaxID=1883414 RepID=UPI00362FB591